MVTVVCWGLGVAVFEVLWQCLTGVGNRKVGSGVCWCRGSGLRWEVACDCLGAEVLALVSVVGTHSGSAAISVCANG